MEGGIIAEYWIKMWKILQDFFKILQNFLKHVCVNPWNWIGDQIWTQQMKSLILISKKLRLVSLYV
jgi:hypothetical protein